MEISVSTNEVNNFSVSELDYIREIIEGMNKLNQIEILRILSKHKDIILNENKYGVHINLSEIKTEVINELNNFIQYVYAQESNLHDVEKQKENFKNIYFKTDSIFYNNYLIYVPIYNNQSHYLLIYLFYFYVDFHVNYNFVSLVYHEYVFLIYQYIMY